MKNLRQSYKHYKEVSNNPIGIKDYLIITSGYNKFLINKVLEGNKVQLPKRMGSLDIEGNKLNIRYGNNGEILSLAPDWQKTKLLWSRSEEARKNKKKIYCTNEHSNGIRYKYMWRRRNLKLRNKQFYSLRLTRANKRALVKLVKQGKQYHTR